MWCVSSQQSRGHSCIWVLCEGSALDYNMGCRVLSQTQTVSSVVDMIRDVVPRQLCEDSRPDVQVVPETDHRLRIPVHISEGLVCGCA